MSAGNCAQIVACLLLALYLMAPGSVIVHILEKTSSCGHAEEPIHLEQPAPAQGAVQSSSSSCSLCEQGDKVLFGSGLLLAHPPLAGSHAAPGDESASMRPGEPPFIPPEGSV